MSSHPSRRSPVVMDAVKKRRDVFAYGLLCVAALYLIAALSLLFKSEQDSGLGFSARAADYGYLFSHPVVVFSLVAAVVLAGGFGEASRNARAVVLAAIGIGGLSLLFAVICWFSGFAADETLGSVFGGVLGAGKIVGIFLGLAQLAFLALAVLLAFTLYQRLPKASSHPQGQWGQQGYGPPQGYPGGQPYGQPQPGYPPPQGWGQPDQGYAQPGGQSSWSTGIYAGGAGEPAQSASPYGDQPHGQPGWGQPPAEQQTWGQPPAEQQSWGQPPAEQQSWGQQPGPQQWGQPPVEQHSWGPPQPGQQSWSEPQQWPEQSGQPAQQWGQYPAGSEPAGSDVAEQAEQADATLADSGQPPAGPPAGAHPADEHVESDTDGDSPRDGGGWGRPPSH